MGAILNPVIKSHNWPGLGVLDADQDVLVRGKVKSRRYSQDSRKEKEPSIQGSHWFESVTWPIKEKEGLTPSFMHKEGVSKLRSAGRVWLTTCFVNTVFLKHIPPSLLLYWLSLLSCWSQSWVVLTDRMVLIAKNTFCLTFD